MQVDGLTLSLPLRKVDLFLLNKHAMKIKQSFHIVDDDQVTGLLLSFYLLRDRDPAVLSMI